MLVYACVSVLEDYNCIECVYSTTALYHGVVQWQSQWTWPPTAHWSVDPEGLLLLAGSHWALRDACWDRFPVRGHKLYLVLFDWISKHILIKSFIRHIYA